MMEPTQSSGADSNILSVLEAAASGGDVLLFELRDGRRISDGVCDVRRECGEDFVVLYANNLVRVSDILTANYPSHDARDEDGDGAVWCSLP